MTAGRIFLLAVAVRWAAALVLFVGWGAPGLMIEDSASYLARAGSVRVPDLMPVFPAYLTLVQAIFGAGPLWPVLGQGLIDGMTCVAIAGAAGTINPRLFAPAGLVAAFNPTQIVMASLVLTETLFICFCALALWAMTRWLRDAGWQPVIGLGLALAAAGLTRVMLLPWVLAVPVLMLVTGWMRAHPVKRLVPQAAVAVLLPGFALGAIAVDNQARFGGFGLSNQSGGHLLGWVVPLVMEARDGTPRDEGARILSERFADLEAMGPDDSFARSRAQTRAAFTVLGELGPAAVAKAWLVGAAINLGAPAVILTTPVRTLPRTGFYATPGDSKFDKIVNFLFRNDNTAYALILAGAGLATLALRGLQVLGLWRLVGGGAEKDRTARAAALILFAWIGFVLAVNGPVASAKYRAPAEPAFVILLAVGLTRLNPPPSRHLA